MGLSSAMLSSNREAEKKQGKTQNLYLLSIMNPKPLQDPDIALCFQVLSLDEQMQNVARAFLCNLVCDWECLGFRF